MLSERSSKQRCALYWLVWFSVILVPACHTAPTESMKLVVPTAKLLPTPDDRAIYSMMTEKYTSWDVIFSIGDMSANEAARILGALLAIEPPADLEVMHEQAVDAYRYICKGKLLLPGADNLGRAEAHFMVDWGVGRLRDYREQLDALP